MRLLDLFAGIGGFSLAAHWMGWETAAFVEWDKFCQKVLTKNFPGVPIYDDIREFDGTPFRGKIDIITGGFPCQPFSQAGKQKGKSDDRYLFPEMLRVIDEVRPTWIVAENVRGLLSIADGSVLSEILSSLESSGYKIAPCCVPASAVEAPHERQRLWIVAHSEGEQVGRGESGSICREERGSRSPLLPRLANADCDASDSEKFGRREEHPDDRGVSERVRAERLGSGLSDDGRDASDSDDERCIGRGEQGKNSGRAVSPGCGNDRALSESSVSDRDASNSKSGEGRTGLRETETVKYGNQFGNGGWINWRESWLEVATALCGMDDGLSAELDFPRDNRVNRLKALGNSIVPQIAFEIFQSINAADSE